MVKPICVLLRLIAASLCLSFSPWTDLPAQGTDLVDTALLGERGVVFEAPTGWGGIEHVRGIGDFNGDGFDDIALSVILRDDPWDNALVVIRGRAGMTGKHRIENGLPGATFVRAGGSVSGATFIETVRGAGDLDGDGFDDFFAGVPGYRFADGRREGAAFAVRGEAEVRGEMFLEDAGGGIPGGLIFSTDPSHASVGQVTAVLSDFNGDGVADLAVSAPTSVNPRGELNAGMVCIIYGLPGLPPAVDLAAIGQGLRGIRIHGITRPVPVVGVETIGLLGQGLEPAGDFDGDGLSDVLVTAGELDPSTVYLILGRPDLPGDVDLEEVETLENVIVFHGPAGNDGRVFGLPRQIAGAGDVNGDGLDDILLGLARSCCPLPLVLPPDSSAHLIYGQPDFPREVQVDAAPPELTTTIHPRGQYDGFAHAVAAGDLDLDGVSDLLLSANAAVNGKVGAGEVHAVLGKRDFASAVFLADGYDGTRLLGAMPNDGLGAQAVPAGDFNGDRVPDLLVAAPLLGPSHPGLARAYLIYGVGAGMPPLTIIGVSPGSGPERGGTPVAISGSGFQAPAAVLFGERASPAVTVVSSSRITAVTPRAAARGLVDVRVSSGGNTRSLPAAFEYTRDFPEIRLASLGESGFILEGNPSGARFGWPAIAGIAIGDITGDGVDELMVEASAPAGWTVAVVRGSADLPPTLHAFSPSPHLTLISTTSAQAADGCTVAVVGDVNLDGIDDLGIGGSDGLGHVLFGRASLPAGEVSIEDEVAAGRAVLLEHGPTSGSSFLMSFSPLADTNGDGAADLAVGLAGAPLEPEVSPDPGPDAGELIFLESRGQWPRVLDLAAPVAALGRIHGSAPGQRLGERLRAAGDVNGDRAPDLLADTVAMEHIGRAFVFYGGRFPPDSEDALTVVTRGDGVVIDLVDGFVHFDWLNIATAGDVNADGFADLLLGAEGGGENLQGVTYLVFGAPDLPESLMLSESPLAPDGVVRLLGEESMVQAGRPGPAGDVDHDGHADFLVGAPGAPEFLGEPGNVFLIFGGASLPASIDLRRAGSLGFKIEGRNVLGGAGSFTGPYGDLNGDGRTDFAFSEHGTVNGDLEYVYVIYNPYAGMTFIRGDANGDGKADISDAIGILAYLFLGGEKLRCLDAADADDSGKVEITDPIYLLGFLFLGSQAPPAPHPEEGKDPSPDSVECLGF